MPTPGHFLVLLALLLPAPGGAAVPDFERDIAPIFEGRCLSCHDAAQAKGDVRLDTREHALAVLAPGKPDTSELIAQVSGPVPDMPKKADPLSPAEVERLRVWISAGAPWPEGRILTDNPTRNLDWWSLRPVGNPSPPAPGHPVDAFVHAERQEKGLRPVPPADPATLIRRLTFDLTGLPPSPEEVAAFVAEAGADLPGAVERHADRLLASPAFGEKWARHWLDLARYGETHGYDKDKPRNHAWPYRDHVIRAFNEDKPYERFAAEQIAGDGLYPGEPDGVLGLGFLAAGPWDLIGHTEVGEAKIDGRIAKHLDRDEMISAVFNVFTSTTVQCAQCHHHKFDPVKMEDYYRLHAVFAAVDRADRVYAGLPPEQERQRNELLARNNVLKAERDKLDGGLKREVAARASGLDRRIAELKAAHGSPLRPQFGWHSAVSQAQDSVKWVQLDLGAPRPVEVVKLYPAHDTFNDIGSGFGFPIRYKIEVSDEAGFSGPVRMLHDATGEDQPNPKDREIAVEAGGAPFRYLRITATKLGPRKNDFIFALGEIEAIGGAEQENFARFDGTAVSSLDSIEAAPRWGRANLTDGIYHRELADPAALAELRDLEDRRAEIEAAVRTPEQKLRLEEIDRDLAALTPQLAAFPPGELVYAAATSFTAQGRHTATGGKPRPIHLFHRGDIRNPGEAMEPGMVPLWPGAPERFPLPDGATEADARAALARSLTATDNPLLWRSIANRLWQWTFGQPLVGTPNDFGRMGMLPTHPELLDFLAARLRDDPRHSLKGIVRLLVTSETYRLSSLHDEANAAIDAGNAYWWRANRRRLSAEEFRDSLLAIAGKLRLEERGGPPFQDFVIEKPQHSPHYQYHLHDPDDPKSHRRSIYRFIVRSQPQPFLTALDCADPSSSVPARDESTTALQALAQWNNRLVEVMARHFGDRITSASPSGDEIGFACRIALGRPPEPSEEEVLRAHLDQHGPASLARVVFNLNAFVYVD